MDIGDKVQHFGTGSIGTVIDSSYEVETPFQQMCVQWEDDLAPHTFNFLLLLGLVLLHKPR